MKVVIDKYYYQTYLIPTVLITENRILDGKYGIGLVWLKWVLEFQF